jgi:hypothetical protein
MPHAFKGFLGVGKQTGSNLRAAKVARTEYARFRELEITENQNEAIDPTSGRRGPESVALGNYDARIRGVLEGTTEGPIVRLLLSVLGGTDTVTNVGTTGREHDVSVGDTLGSFSRLTAEARYGTNAESELVNFLCSLLRFKLDQQGYAWWEFEGLASSPEYLATPSTPTLPAIPTLLNSRTTTFTFDGVNTHVVRNLSVELKNHADEDDFDLSSRQRREAEYGELEATFDAELVFANMTNQRRFWGGAALTAPSDVDVYYPVTIVNERTDVIPGGTAKHGVSYSFPKARITCMSTPQQGKDQVRQRVTGRAIFDSATSKDLTAKITNSVAAYA